MSIITDAIKSNPIVAGVDSSLAAIKAAKEEEGTVFDKAGAYTGEKLKTLANDLTFGIFDEQLSEFDNEEVKDFGKGTLAAAASAICPIFGILFGIQKATSKE